MIVEYTSIGDRVLERSGNTLITRLYQIQQNLVESDDDVKVKGSVEEGEE